MAALWNIVAGTIKESDIVLEVVDARCVMDTRSIKLEKLAQRFNKKIVIVVNKTDLISNESLNMLKKNIDLSRVFVSSKKRFGTRELKEAIFKRSKKNESAKVCVVGYPNTGKSSVINLLIRKKSAKESSQPGYTKGTQWLRLKDNIMLLDTPGVVPQDEYFSVLKSNIRPESVEDPESFAEELLEKIKDSRDNNIKEIYGIGYKDIDSFLSVVASNACYFKKGGIPDTGKAARKIIIDWNAGTLTAFWY
ncbi:MAG: 50S ribosome-binding GTPase [Candidatus Aenigmarchaeota archaeon]|nr:50S ribosome-binding GTPase [Candidatus Aenigmarchaeota archaeon]